jgi:hypothetical protein
MGQLAEIRAIERGTFALIKDYFQERRTEITVADIDTATFICVTAVEALTHEFVIRQPDATSRERDRFVDEVTMLIVGYLLPHPAFASSPTRRNPSRAKRARIPAAKPLRQQRNHS